MQAETIVQLLARTSPLAFDSQEERTCGLCWVSDGVNGDGPVLDLTKPRNHLPECPWRLALEWVASR